MKFSRHPLKFYIVIATWACLACLFSPSQLPAEEKDSQVIRVRDVRGSVESSLTATAVNHAPIAPTPSPKVRVGDVVTFRVNIENNYSTHFYGLAAEAGWGEGFAYQGSLSGENIEAAYDKQANKITASIPEILPSEKMDTPCMYTFDLKVTGCEDLFVNVYTDELYACEAVKTYYLPIQIKPPNIRYAITPPAIAISDDNARQAIEIKNTGQGKANDFAIDTNFEAMPLNIKNISEEFTYDAANGIFKTDAAISPGKAVTLKFDIHPDTDQPAKKTSDSAFAAPVIFQPVYTGECGTRFEAPPKSADLKINGRAGPVEPPDTAGAPDLALRVSPECRRVLSPEEPLAWTISVINRGSGTARDVVLHDKLGRHLRYLPPEAEPKTATPKQLKDIPADGLTSVTWELGDIAPGELRSARVSAYPEAPENETADYFNTIHVKYGDEDQCCDYREIEAPCFIRPDECIEGDVFESCGRVHGFFSLTQMYKSNLYRTADDPEGVWATYLTPGIWAAVPGSCDRIVEIVTSSATPGGLVISPFYPKTNRKYQSYLLYSPQYEIYHDHSDENMLTHRADAYFRYNTRNKLSIRALDQFKKSHDSISSRAFTIDDRYKTNLFNTLGTLDLTEKLRLRLDYSNFYLDYDSSENSRADRMDNAWAAYGYFNLTSKTAVFANYEFSDIDYDSNDLDSRENRWFAGLRWDITQKTGGQAKVGFGEKNYDQPGLSDLDTWMAEIQLDHTLTSRTNVVLNAYRRYDEVLGELVDKDDLKENFSKGILTHFIGLSLNQDLTTKLHLSLDATYFYDKYEDEERLSTRKEREDTEFAISPAVKFDFMKWLTFDLAYTYTNRDSNYNQFDYEDHTVFLRASIFQ
ncbi:MAG: outer membrane beta-barrel protein [Desulfobacterales bacterium]